MKKVFIVCSSLLLLNTSLSAQEKTEYKIKDNGKDSVNITIWEKQYRAFYTGQYLKKLNGEKGFYAHGKGKVKFLISNDSAFYEGDFFEGKATGAGKINTGSWSYEGTLENGIANDYGLYINHKNSKDKIKTVKGTFKNGKCNGKAIITYTNGNEYDGTVVNGVLEGLGTLNYFDGSIKDGTTGNKIKICATFNGNWNNNIRKGEGTMYYVNGDSLKGDWNDNLFTGKGKLTFEDGSIYDGEWLNGLPNGSGLLKLSNGELMSGEWKENLFTGKAKIKLDDGSLYEGHLSNNKPDGNGVLTSIEGDIYEGVWKQGMRNGFGVEKNKNGEVWRCNWKDDFPSDSGSVKFKNGAVYVGGVGGKLIDGKKTFYFNGFGNFYEKLESADSSIINYSSYVGFYSMGLRHGKGKETTKEYNLEHIYDGEWVNGFKQGKGVSESNEEMYKEVYDGNWFNDKKHGKGKLIITEAFSETIITGIWENELLNGYGEMITNSYEPDKNEEKIVYKGNFKNGKKHGQGTEISAEGTYTGNWENNEKNGLGKTVTKTGKIYEGKFTNGSYEKPFECRKAIIGTQTWMAENLKITKFKNGDPIPEAKTIDEWIYAGNNKQPAYCYYNNDPSTASEYGIIYNWYAITDSRGIAPNGWKVPTHTDIKTLTEFAQKELYEKLVKIIEISNNGINSLNEGKEYYNMTEKGSSYLGGVRLFSKSAFIGNSKTKKGIDLYGFSANNLPERYGHNGHFIAQDRIRRSIFWTSSFYTSHNSSAVIMLIDDDGKLNPEMLGTTFDYREKPILKQDYDFRDKADGYPLRLIKE